MPQSAAKAAVNAPVQSTQIQSHDAVIRPKATPAPSAPQSRPVKARKPQERHFFVAISGTTHGPYPESMMASLVTSGRVVRANHVCEKGESAWTVMGEHKLFSALFGPSRLLSASQPANHGKVVDFHKATETTTDKQPVLVNSAFAVGNQTRVFMTKAGLDGRNRKAQVVKWVGLVFGLMVMTGLVFLGVAFYTYEPEPVIEYATAADGTVTETKRLRSFREKATSNFDFLLGKKENTKVVVQKRRSSKKKTRGFDAPKVTKGTKDSNAGEAADIRLALAGMEGMKKAPSKVRNSLKVSSIVVESSGVLSAKQITDVIKRHKSSVTTCMEQSYKNNEKLGRRGKFVITIEPSGKVVSGRPLQPILRGTMFSKCLTRAVKRWRFPAFDGQAFEVELPLIFQ